MITVREKDLRFYIKESTQPNSGLGLFASQDIKKGDHLEVIGIMVDRGSVADLCTSFANNFKFAADYADSFKKHIIPVGYAGMVNHANEKKDQNVQIKYIKKNNEHACVYYFLKDVKKDQEVLGDYGEGWRTMADWVNKVNSESEEDQDLDWNTFLEFDLYNLGKLKKHAAD